MNGKLSCNSEYRGWLWLILFSTAIWAGVGFGIRALIAAL
jgi:hypothetical protein